MGSVPIRPDSRFPTPSAFRAPWTTRKSVARGVRCKTLWIAAPSPTVSIAPTSVTTTNAGSSAQNSTPGVTSIPGHDPIGTPTQGASSIVCTSYSPNGAATAQPTAMPMTGDHSRKAGGARSTSPATVTSVASAAAGATPAGVPSGASVSVLNTNGKTVAAISMMTVPDTTGVNIRRSSDSRAASRNWKSDDTTIKLAIVSGPPLTKAATHTAMNAPDVPMTSRCPAPTLPNRTACRTVVTPLTSSAANAPKPCTTRAAPLSAPR